MRTVANVFLFAIIWDLIGCYVDLSGVWFHQKAKHGHGLDSDLLRCHGFWLAVVRNRIRIKAVQEQRSAGEFPGGKAMTPVEERDRKECWRVGRQIQPNDSITYKAPVNGMLIELNPVYEVWTANKSQMIGTLTKHENLGGGSPKFYVTPTNHMEEVFEADTLEHALKRLLQAAGLAGAEVDRPLIPGKDPRAS